MLKFNIICVGTLKEKYWQLAQAEYLKRLSRYLHIKIIEIAAEICPDEKKQACIDLVKKAEGEKILTQCKQADLTIALEAAGKQMTSEEWARQIDQAMLSGKVNINLIIGGSYGLAKEVLHKADLLWSFSRLTFPHQMIRIFLLEQIYRAMKISHHETYHK